MQEKKPYNPFIFKGPVQGDDFFGRDNLIEKIFYCINVGESVSLVGERRTGKTSILLRVLQLKGQFLSQRRQHVLALLDFLGLSYQTEIDIWVTLLNNLSEEMSLTGLKTEPIAEALKQLRARKSIAEKRISHILLGMLRRLTRDGVSVTFLFDEFEATAQGENQIDLGFYKLLRNLATDRRTRLTYVIATRQELSTVEKTLEQKFTSLSSPLFNIFHQLTIPPFSEDEARQMVNSLLQSTDIDLGKEPSFWLQHRDFLFQLSGFHPFFLQIACYHLFEHSILPSGTFSNQVPEDKIISAFLGEASPHFQYYWDVSSTATQELMGQLSVDEGDVDVGLHHPTIESLENRCLVVQDVEAKSGWRLFSSAFARWVEEKIELEQQLHAWYDEGIAHLEARAGQRKF